ncbi:PREDICTED: DENN domain-containing protein 3-like, partial [Nanorana parkeri]|uniref:DENN domain-containing protein 3-like n=1 Tax=Nanorana parkeri TaxID=125878 RepID=UPI000854A01F
MELFGSAEPKGLLYNLFTISCTAAERLSQAEPHAFGTAEPKTQPKREERFDKLTWTPGHFHSKQKMNIKCSKQSEVSPVLTSFTFGLALLLCSAAFYNSYQTKPVGCCCGRCELATCRANHTLSGYKPEIVAQKGIRNLQTLEPEITSVFVPPFIPKEETATTSAQNNFQRLPRRRSFRKKKEKPKFEVGSANGGSETTTEEISVPKDIDLIGLPQLCFPGGLPITSEPKEDTFHFLVFTDVLGNRTYGAVAQFSRSIQDTLGLSNGQAYWDSSSSHIKTYDTYTSFALCVISRYPYYTALKDCLSCFLVQLKSCKESDLDERIKEFAAKLSLIPNPPPGPLHLVFNMKPLQIFFPSREDPESPIIDLDLHLPFLCFTPKQVLQIMACILTECSIVFFSSDWALLTLVAECFMVYLHPIKWQHTFVPILSRHMLDFIMAPTSFLMGCHVDHYNEVRKEAEDLVLINIDHGNISFIVNEDEEEIDAADIPVEAAEMFMCRVESLQLHYDRELCHRSAPIDIGEVRLRRRLWQHNLNTEIQEIALQLIVDIFRWKRAPSHPPPNSLRHNARYNTSWTGLTTLKTGQGFPAPCKVKRAHRVGPLNTERKTPRPVIVRFLDYTDRLAALQAYRAKKELHLEEKRLLIFADYSAE